MRDCHHGADAGHAPQETWQGMGGLDPVYLSLLRLVAISLRAVIVSEKSMRILGLPSPTSPPYLDHERL
jgi:hypothetical protein